MKKLLTIISKLSDKEKRLLSTAVSGLIIFIAFQIILFPGIEKRKKLEKMILSKENELNKICSLQQEYNKIQRKIILYEKSSSKKNFSLFSFLDQLARQSNIKNNVVSMKPYSHKQQGSVFTLSYVKIKLDSVYMKDLVDFLYRIETSSKGVYVNSLSLSSKKGKEKNMLYAVLEVAVNRIGDFS